MSRPSVDTVIAMDRMVLEAEFHRAWDEIVQLRARLNQPPDDDDGKRLLALMYPRSDQIQQASTGKKKHGHPTLAQATDWFDPNLRSNVVEYDKNGATIRDVRFTTMSGKLVNHLMVGSRYSYQYTVDFAQEAEDVSFGMLFKTIQGFELAGASSERNPSRRVALVRSGQSIEAKFTFTCKLMPGAYFTNAGVIGSRNGGERRYLHRLMDALAFRVMPDDATLDNGYFSQEACLTLSVLGAPHRAD
jgi:lipopolysaccharide transport system ATP-binding protein